MSDVFVYIATKQTADPVIPSLAPNLPAFSRSVSDAFYGLLGGYQRVGQLAFFPVQRSVPNHLLCDGREVAKVQFPELYAFLGDSQGTPADPDNFVLPAFIGGAAVTPAATADTETANEGTVSTPVPVGGSEDFYGDTDSGGRFQREINSSF